MTDAEYPTKSAFSILNKIMDEFTNIFTNQQEWPTLTPAITSTRYPQLQQHLVSAQNPRNADPFMKVQQELDETKIILHKTMEGLLQRKNIVIVCFFSQ